MVSTRYHRTPPRSPPLSEHPLGDAGRPDLGLAFDVSNWSGVFTAGNLDAPQILAPRRPLSVARPQALGAGRPVGLDAGEPLTASAASAIRALGYDRGIIGTQNEAIARAQAKACLAAGIALDAYVYLYFSGDPRAQVEEALRRMDGIPLGMLWLDCEDAYAEQMTERAVVDFIGEAARACENRIWSGIYTAGWWWVRQTGNSTAFAGWKLWHASADRTGDLNPVSYGGWTDLHMEQYQFDVPLAGVNTDLNVYRRESVAPPPEPEPTPPVPNPGPPVGPNIETTSPRLKYHGWDPATSRHRYTVSVDLGILDYGG